MLGTLPIQTHYQDTHCFEFGNNYTGKFFLKMVHLLNGQQSKATDLLIRPFGATHFAIWLSGWASKFGLPLCDSTIQHYFRKTFTYFRTKFIILCIENIVSLQYIIVPIPFHVSLL